MTLRFRRRYVRELVSIENEDEVELLEVTTELIAAALSRVVRGYAAQLHPARGIVVR